MLAAWVTGEWKRNTGGWGCAANSSRTHASLPGEYPKAARIAASSNGAMMFWVVSAHKGCISFMAASRWVRLVKVSKAWGSAPTNSGDTEMSMSSENRSITPNTFESEVPPLKTRWGANSGCENKAPSSQHTQKYFSITTALTAR